MSTTPRTGQVELDAALALLEGDTERGGGALQVVSKVLLNIVGQPDDLAKRKLRLGNTNINDKVLNVNGGRELFLALGFQIENSDEGEDFFKLPLPSVKPAHQKQLERLQQASVHIQKAIESFPRPATFDMDSDSPVPSPARKKHQSSPPEDSQMADDAVAEAAMLEQALAMSKAEAETKADADMVEAEDEDEEAMLAKALAISEGADTAAIETSGGASSTNAADFPSTPSQEAFKRRVNEIHSELVAAGVSYNDAAVQAVQKAQAELAAAAPASAPDMSEMTSVAPALDLTTQDGVQARVKELFTQAVAAGKEAPDAVASAMKQAQEEAAAQTAQVAAAKAAEETASARAPTLVTAPTVDTIAAASQEVDAGVTSPGTRAATFERTSEVEKVDAAELEAIRLRHEYYGEQFVDPSFPPTNKVTAAALAAAGLDCCWSCCCCSCCCCCS
jgi:hypothetical protein